MGVPHGISFIEVSFKHHTENGIQFQEAEELFFIFSLTLSIQHLDRYIDRLIKILHRSQKAELHNTLQNFTMIHYIKYVKIHEYN